MNEQELKDYQDKPIHIEFQAKIVDGANLEAYRSAEDGTEKVPKGELLNPYRESSSLLPLLYLHKPQ